MRFLKRPGERTGAHHAKHDCHNGSLEKALIETDFEDRKKKDEGKEKRGYTRSYGDLSPQTRQGRRGPAAAHGVQESARVGAGLHVGTVTRREVKIRGRSGPGPFPDT